MGIHVSADRAPGVIGQGPYFVAAGVHIMVMPPHVIVMGMPMAIIFVMASQRSRIISRVVPSMGATLQVMPSLPISRVARHITTGIMPIMLGIIMPGIIGIMPGIIEPIMPGIIMPGIIGIMPGIIEPIMLGIMGIIMPGIIEVWGIAGMFMAAIMVVSSSVSAVAPSG
jgi:hypothetical protein